MFREHYRKRYRIQYVRIFYTTKMKMTLYRKKESCDFFFYQILYSCIFLAYLISCIHGYKLTFSSEFQFKRNFLATANFSLLIFHNFIYGILINLVFIQIIFQSILLTKRSFFWTLYLNIILLVIFCFYYQNRELKHFLTFPLLSVRIISSLPLPSFLSVASKNVSFRLRSVLHFLSVGWLKHYYLISNTQV